MTIPEIHPRTTIRRAIKALLIGRTDAEERVTSNLGRPFDPDGPPELRVYSRREDSDVFEESPRTNERAMTIAIECYRARETTFANDTEGVDDLLDRLCWQVERIIGPWLRSGRLASECGIRYSAEKTRFAGLETDFGDEGARIEGGARLQWEVVYYTEDTVCPDELPSLEGIDLDWDPTPGGELEAEDAIDLEQV